MAKRKRNGDFTKSWIPDDWLARRAVAGGWLAGLAAQVLLVRYSTMAYHFARSFRLQHSDALNAVQEACLKSLCALVKGKYDPDKGRFGGWFFTIVKRECLAIKRKGKIYVGASENSVFKGPELFELVTDPLPIPEEFAEAEELTETLNQALQTLTHAERFVVEMRLHYRWTLDQCAAYLEINIAKVFQLYRRGLKKTQRFVETAELRAASSGEIRESLDARQRKLLNLTQQLLDWQAPLGNSSKLGRAISFFQKTARRVELVCRKPLRIGQLSSLSRPLLYQHAVELQWKLIECARHQVASVEREPTNIEHYFHLRDLVLAMQPLVKELDLLDFRDERQRRTWRLRGFADG